MTITPSHLLDTAIKKIIPGGNDMDTRRFLVIHFTAGASGQSSIDYWKQLDNGVCAHVVIERDGTILQVRGFDKTCGHAGPPGKSRWKDPKTGVLFNGLNACSIGIELANGGDSYPTKFTPLPATRAVHKNGGPHCIWETYPQAQINACTELSKALVERYNLDDVIGHEDCSRERKVDPGPAFPMKALREACGFTAPLQVVGK